MALFSGNGINGYIKGSDRRDGHGSAVQAVQRQNKTQHYASQDSSK